MSSAVRLTALSAALAAALMCGSAHANDYTDIAQLLKNGKSEQALQRADTYLTGNPRDPQMRFLKAVALTNLNRTDDAVAALRQLTEDYPELPEPYNNLAVIYARQGELEKARAALENAVRNNPDYAVAHENLGDIHVRLAYQSYAQARAKGGRATNLQPKMKLLREVLQLSATAVKPALPAVDAPAAAEPPAHGTHKQ
jgi:Flp pilus assembly protein TadD